VAIIRSLIKGAWTSHTILIDTAMIVPAGRLADHIG